MISSTGIGSGLDVASLVEQLVQSERQPTEFRLARVEARVQAKLSAIGQFRGAMSGLNDALTQLGGTGATGNGAFDSRVATSSDTDKFTAQAEAAAVPGEYQIEVLQLASAHRVNSDPFASSSTYLGYGTLTLNLGAESFEVDLGIGEGTLENIRDAINEAADNVGIGATLVTADDGVRLVLSSDTPGAAETISITASGGLPPLLDLSELETLYTLDPAQDAQVKVDGFLTTSTQNSIADAIDGVTIDLLEADVGNTHTLTVSRGEASMTAAIQTFVDQYNSVLDTVSDLTRVSGGGQGSVMTGDAMLRGVGGQLRALATRSFGSGEIKSLADVGIGFDESGRLELDGAALDAALGSQHAEVTTFFTAETGVAAIFERFADGYLNGDGLLDSREDSLNARLERIGDQRLSLDRRIARMESRYLSQFSALDGLIASLRQTSDFLAQQLKSLPGA